MATTVRSKGILPGLALLGAGVACLLFAYVFVAGPTKNDNPSAAAPAIQPEKAAAAPTEPPQRDARVEAGPTGFVAAPTYRAPDDTTPESQTQLQETELEHLREVFQNSVAPSFQYDFQLNHEGRSAIDAFVASMPEDLGSADLETLSTMIESQLSTPAAADLAFIITHQYRLEREEARLMKEIGPVTTMAGQQEVQAQLAQLREEWFGPELSGRLFGEAEEGQPVAADDNTGEAPQPRSEEQAELASIETQWQQRYQAFLAEKHFIDNAGLDRTEKDRQIEALLQQHYAPDELEAARAFDQLEP